MNESVGGSLLLNLVVVVIGTMIAIFTASFAYNKAYRAKSIIIDEIQNYIKTENKDLNNIEELTANINEQLTNMGYRLTKKECPTKENKQLINHDNSSYCIYEVAETDDIGNQNIYYEVQTYMYFDIPLVNFSIPVKGQTVSFRKNIVNVNMEGEL